MATVAGALALASACTMKDQEPPALTGPSELGQSIHIAVSPDVLPQDGASQSFVTVTARNADSQPIRNLSMRAETRVGGTPVDFGSLSARSIVTGSDGKATLVYTAPPSPAVSPDAFLMVDIVITPLGTDFNNSSERSAAIRLVPQGTVIPPGNLKPAFTVTPNNPQENQTVLFDASTSTGTISEYAWEFGDGARGSGATATHAYGTAGTYVVRLTVEDGFGRTASTSQSITVGTGSIPTAAFVFSPSAPAPGDRIFFNGSGSRATGPGRRLVNFRWDFGDGDVGDFGELVEHRYLVAGEYSVTLVVTDDGGRRSAPITVRVAVAVPGGGGGGGGGGAAPTAAFTFAPAPRVGVAVTFNAGTSTAGSGSNLTAYNWNFGDGTTAVGPTPQHTFTSVGPFNVTLTVIDNQSRTANATQTLTVTP
jgi:PKD repeat protein